MEKKKENLRCKYFGDFNHRVTGIKYYELEKILFGVHKNV